LTDVIASQNPVIFNFRLVASDFQPDGLPDLADADAQRFFDAAIGDSELIVVDNLSTIARGLRENEADSFGSVQAWLLAQRAAGRSVLVVHHDGNGGGQRGTSRKEDTLDTVISLSRPPGYVATEGARFEVRFTKSRGFWGEEAEPFEAKFAGGNWMTSEIVADDSDEALSALGIPRWVETWIARCNARGRGANDHSSMQSSADPRRWQQYQNWLRRAASSDPLASP
jgi:hypothetical protein